MKNESISVIIVSKNEEKRIQACIESVIGALNEYDDFEIILVDSASTDRTIDIAKRYNIKIIQLRPNWQHSAAAGEHIGYLHSKGEYICFIGGDMILNQDWFKEAIPCLKKEDVAGVSGKIINNFDVNNCSSLVAYRINFGFNSLKCGEVDVLGGPAMFKRSVLKEVGGYHPFLRAGEEAELSYRIRVKGYKLIRLPIPMVYHKSECMSLLKFLYKYQWEYVKAVGSSIRYSLRTNKQIFYKRFPAIFIAMFFNLSLLLVVVSLALLLKGYTSPITTVLAGYSLLFILLIIKRKNIKDAMLSILVLHISALAICIGFLKDLPNPQEYPNNPIIIKLRTKT